MSFLPYGNTQTGMWLSSLGASTAAHGGLVALLLTTSIPFLPDAVVQGADEEELFVSLEILDASIITDLEPVTDEVLAQVEEGGLLPEDLAGDTPDALDPTDDFAVPDEVLAPEEIQAEELAALEPEPEVVEPEAIEPEPVAPDVAEPDVIEPEVVEPEPEEPELAEPEVVEPEITEPEPEELPPVIAQPEVLEPEEVEDDTLFVGDASPVEDDFINPLAEGGGVGVDTGIEPIFLDEPETPDIVELQPELEGEEVIAAITPQEAETPDIITLPKEEEQVTDVALPEIEEGGEEEVIAALPESDAGEDGDTTDGVEDGAEVGDAADGTGRGLPIAAPSDQDLALGLLLRQIRATPTPQCTAFLPRRAGNDGMGLSMLGADEVSLAEIADEIDDRMTPEFIRSLEVIDARQCAVLDAVRQAESYPASRLGLAIEELQLRSGDSLRVKIDGAGGLYITVLVIDDNGVVQDLSRFAELVDGVPTIDAPVARAGSSRATLQLLLAIGTRAPIDISAGIGGEAQDVFALLDPDTLENMVYGLAAFDVQ